MGPGWNQGRFRGDWIGGGGRDEGVRPIGIGFDSAKFPETPAAGWSWSEGSAAPVRNMSDNMPDTLKTRPTLLSKVRRGDEEGWSRFYELYEEFFFSAARGAGLSHDESRDVVQEAMITVRDYIDHFAPDPARGRFRTWLRAIVQSRIADQFRRKRRNPLEKAAPTPPVDETSTSTMERIPNLREVEMDRLIDGKLEEAILAEARRLAREKVRIEDYQAYDLFKVRELKAREVALSLGINAVTVRVRALRVRRSVDRELRRIARSLDAKRPA